MGHPGVKEGERVGAEERVRAGKWWGRSVGGTSRGSWSSNSGGWCHERRRRPRDLGGGSTRCDCWDWTGDAMVCTNRRGRSTRWAVEGWV
jgi:hypothetical protein